MGVCTKCQSEKVSTTHTDRKIITRCKVCGHVEVERYGRGRIVTPSEAEKAAETVQG